jgi:D-inositol-3-phosphate glycosyltransferase
MKIAVFVNYLPPHVGGVEVVVDRQVRLLRELNQDVEVLTSACGAARGLSRELGLSIRRISCWNFLERRLGAPFPIPSISIIWHGYRAVRDADVVHAHDSLYALSLVAAIWCKLLRKPLVVTEHVDLVPHPSAIVHIGQRLINLTCGRYVLRSSAHVIVLNARVREFVKSQGVEMSRVSFLPNGVDTNEYSPVSRTERVALRVALGLPVDKELGLFVGRFVPKKGFDKLLRLESLKNLDLVFVGGSAPEGHSRSDHHFLGIVGRAEMPAVYRACDIFVLPSIGEGFPVTVQEAMAAGLAVVVTDDPAYEPYGFDRGKVMLIESTASAISHSLETVMKDQALRMAMAQYSRSFAVQNFNWGNNVSSLLGLYDDVLEDRDLRARRLV